MTSPGSEPPIDCRELRRRLLIDPYDADPRLRGHREQCPDCDRAANEALAFESRLRRALSVEAPQGLEKRLRDAPRRKIRGRLAAAAGIVLSLALAGWMGSGLLQSGPDGLAEAVAAHIQAEEEHLHRAGEVRRAELAALLQALGGRLSGDLGEVRFAGVCVVRDREGAHLVIKGRQGPVTLMLLPDQHLERPRRVSAGRLEGVVLPTEYGSLAVVGEPGEPIRALSDDLRRAVHWSI